MRLTKALLSGVAALALSTGAAFAGGDSMSQGSMSQDLMSQESFQLYQQERDYTAMPHDYEVYDVYIVPAEDVVLIPFEPSEPAISGNELG
jgi:hypothetical protein